MHFIGSSLIYGEKVSGGAAVQWLKRKVQGSVRVVEVGEAAVPPGLLSTT